MSKNNKADKNDAKPKEEIGEDFDIKEIYTPLSVAKEEIWRRWNDPVLRKKACPSTNF